MITADGFFDWAHLQLGPEQKSGYPSIKDSNPEGVVYHSAEGSAAALLAALMDSNREASWTASNMKDGRFIQHYPVRRIVWTNGSKQANVKFRGVESEGVAGEPLTAAQTHNLIRCAQDMRDFFGWPGFLRNREAWEHRQMTAFGSSPTACPSGRIPWDIIIPAVNMEDDMAITPEVQAQFDELKTLIKRADLKVPIKMVGRTEIYFYDLTEQRLVSAVGADEFLVGATFDEVNELPKTHAVWKLPTTYQGVPAELRV